MQILLREIRSFYRSISNVIFTCAFPLVMVFLLGTMLENIEQSEYDIGEIHAGYITETKETYITGWDNFISELEKESNITFQEYEDNADARQKLHSGELCAVIYLKDDNVEIEGGNNVTKDRAVKSMVDGYLMTSDTVSAVLQENPTAIEKIQNISTNHNLVKQKACTASRSMIDYYAVTMLVMMMFMGGLTNISNSIHDDRKNTTLNRIYGSPKNKTLVFLEIILGNIPYVFVQIVIVMIGSVFLFHASYCSDLQGNLMLFFMLFSASMAVLAFSAVIGLLFRKRNPFALIMGISWFMLFLSGSFAKDVCIKGFSEYLPTAIIQNAAFDITIFNRYTQAWQVIVVSFVLFVAMLGAGTILFERGEKQI